jgi:hypothetical protein
LLRRSASLPLLVIAAALCISERAGAAPQWNSGIVAGVAGTGESPHWSNTKFFGALRGEALFRGVGPVGIGLGPALEVGTAGFSDARFGAGATLLVPLDGVVALGVSPGSYVRTAHGSAEAGISARLFFGVHPSNIVGSYALAGGVLLGADRDVGGSKSSALIASLQVDGMVLALPVILLVEWIRGPRD